MTSFLVITTCGQGGRRAGHSRVANPAREQVAFHTLLKAGRPASSLPAQAAAAQRGAPGTGWHAIAACHAALPPIPPHQLEHRRPTVAAPPLCRAVHGPVLQGLCGGQASQVCVVLHIPPPVKQAAAVVGRALQLALCCCWCRPAGQRGQQGVDSRAAAHQPDGAGQNAAGERGCPRFASSRTCWADTHRIWKAQAAER